MKASSWSDKAALIPRGKYILLKNASPSSKHSTRIPTDPRMPDSWMIASARWKSARKLTSLLSQNLLTVPAGDIGRTRALKTLVGGKIAYDIRP